MKAIEIDLIEHYYSDKLKLINLVSPYYLGDTDLNDYTGSQLVQMAKNIGYDIKLRGGFNNE